MRRLDRSAPYNPAMTILRCFGRRQNRSARLAVLPLGKNLVLASPSLRIRRQRSREVQDGRRILGESPITSFVYRCHLLIECRVIRETQAMRNRVLSMSNRKGKWARDQHQLFGFVGDVPAL
jgi:hypothetical protein